MCQDNCLNPCISCIDDGHPLRPAKPRCGERESQVFTACPACYLSIQTSTSPSQELLTCFTWLYLSQTQAPQPVNEWNHTYIHMHLSANPFLFLLSPFLTKLLLFPSGFWTMLQTPQCCALQTLNITTPSSLRNAFSPMSPQYFTDFILLVYNNRMVHWTNTKLDSHYTSFYSCHHTECNTAQMHIANEY